MFQRIWPFVSIQGRLYHSFPDDGASRFKELTIPGQCRWGFSFHPLEGEASLAVNRVDLLHPFPFHPHDIALAKPRELVIDLIAHPSFALLWQTVILFAGLPGTKSNAIDVGLWHWDD